MADISSITLPGGGTYDLKDKNAVPKYGMGKNLMRNWYFLNPVNQRGNVTLTISNATRYFVDGWRANGTCTLSLSANGLTIAATGQVYFQQFLSDILPWGKSITASMLTTDGITTFSGTLPASKPAASTVILFATDSKGRFALINDASNFLNLQIRTDSTTRTVVAVKLELGTEQTLAHQENDTWVLNEIPDYEYELYRCITSTADSSDTYANKSLATEQQLAYVETGTTASRAYAVGEYFCWNGLLYLAKTAISNGGTFTPGTNCEQVTVGDALKFAIYTGTAETSTVPGTSYTVINRISPLPAGKYLIVGSASNGTNVSGTLALTITNATAGVNVVTNRTSTENGGGNTVCAIVELSAASTITLRATQTTGSSLSLNTKSLTAIKLA